MKDPKSKARSKSLAIKVGKAFVDGLGPPGKIAIALREHSLSIRRDDQDARNAAFHEQLFHGLDDPGDRTRLFAALVDQNAARDYAAVLEAALRDDEADKVPHYARLLRFLALGPPDDRSRRYVIRLLRDLTRTDIELALSIYADVEEALRAAAESADKAKTESAVIQRYKHGSGKHNRPDAWRRLSMQKLESFGVLHWDGDVLLSDLARLLMRALRVA